MHDHQPQLPLRLPVNPGYCELCHREDVLLTKHHAIPKSLHNKAYVRKHISKEEKITHVLWLCRPCHDCIHKILGEKQIMQSYRTVDALMTVPEIASFVHWIKTKPAGFKPKK
jgi:hypothetical protein